MKSVSAYHTINSLLGMFDERQRVVDTGKRFVDNFIVGLSDVLATENRFYSQHSTFRMTGGSYERTAVCSWADYDVAMILNKVPYTQFTVVGVDEPGLYKIKFANIRNMYVNSRKFLKVNLFRHAIFAELRFALKQMGRRGWDISYQQLSSVIKVRVSAYKIDIAPQIAVPCCSWLLPGWDHYSVPADFFMSSEENFALFNLSCPPGFKKNYSHLVVQPSFSLIEMTCMKQSNVLRDSVRIAKAVAKTFKWYKKGLRSFHLKRIAISLYSEIEYINDPWDGYTRILIKLSDMLDYAKVEGLFIKCQNLLFKTREECNNLQDDVEQILDLIEPYNILDYVNS